MAASSMSVFQSTQAIAATGIFITLGTVLLSLSDSYYPLIWGVAILGPAIGFFLIRQMEYPEQDSGRLDEFSSEVKGKLGGWLDRPLKLDTLEPSKQNQRMALAVGLAGLVILAGIVGIASVAEVDKEVIGDLESVSTVSVANISEDSSTERMGPGVSMSMEIDASNGSILDVVVTVTSSNPSAGLTNPDFTWDLTLSAPQAVMMAGENTSSSTVQDDVISATTELDIEVYNKSGFASQSEAQAWLDDRKGDEDSMYAAGIWNVDLSITGDGDPFQNRQADFTIEVSLSQANATVELSVVENTTITQSEDFGPMLMGVGGLPIIVLTGGVCWLVMRDEESD